MKNRPRNQILPVDLYVIKTEDNTLRKISCINVKAKTMFKPKVTKGVLVPPTRGGLNTEDGVLKYPRRMVFGKISHLRVKPGKRIISQYDIASKTGITTSALNKAVMRGGSTYGLIVKKAGSTKPKAVKGRQHYSVYDENGNHIVLDDYKLGNVDTTKIPVKFTEVLDIITRHLYLLAKVDGGGPYWDLSSQMGDTAAKKLLQLRRSSNKAIEDYGYVRFNVKRYYDAALTMPAKSVHYFMSSPEPFNVPPTIDLPETYVTSHGNHLKRCNMHRSIPVYNNKHDGTNPDTHLFLHVDNDIVVGKHVHQEKDEVSLEYAVESSIRRPVAANIPAIHFRNRSQREGVCNLCLYDEAVNGELATKIISTYIVENRLSVGKARVLKHRLSHVFPHNVLMNYLKSGFNVRCYPAIHRCPETKEYSWKIGNVYNVWTRSKISEMILFSSKYNADIY